jgi:hypothetical protein
MPGCSVIERPSPTFGQRNSMGRPPTIWSFKSGIVSMVLGTLLLSFRDAALSAPSRASDPRAAAWASPMLLSSATCLQLFGRSTLAPALRSVGGDCQEAGTL